MFTLPLQHNSFLEGGFRILMMSATLRRHGIECVDLDQNGGVCRPLKASRTACRPAWRWHRIALLSGP